VASCLLESTQDGEICEKMTSGIFGPNANGVEAGGQRVNTSCCVNFTCNEMSSGVGRTGQVTRGSVEHSLKT